MLEGTTCTLFRSESEEIGISNSGSRLGVRSMATEEAGVDRWGAFMPSSPGVGGTTVTRGTFTGAERTSSRLTLLLDVAVLCGTGKGRRVSTTLLGFEPEREGTATVGTTGALVEGAEGVVEIDTGVER